MPRAILNGLDLAKTTKYRSKSKGTKREKPESSKKPVKQVGYEGISDLRAHESSYAITKQGENFSHVPRTQPQHN